MKPTRGFVFATTGPEYTALAQRAARSVRQHCPEIPIDLFTDHPYSDDVFEQVHQLNTSWIRPKMESLYRSRFAHTVYLDADIFVIADIRDIFELLNRADIAAAHDQFRNSASATQMYSKPIPAAFPQYNSGVIGVAHNENTQIFLRNWEQGLQESDLNRDQPVFRELLYESSLSVCTLPSEYNVNHAEHLRALNSYDCAPRVIHHYYFHRHIGSDRNPIDSVEALLGTRLNNHMQSLISADTTLGANADTPFVRAFCDKYPGKMLPPPGRTKNIGDLKRRFRHPFRGTYGETWYKAIKGWFTKPSG